MVRLALLGLALVGVLAACDWPGGPTAQPGASTAASLLTATPVPGRPPAPEPSVDVMPTSALTVSNVITLTMWTTEWFSPTQDITSGQILAQQVDLYEADHSRVRFEFVLKEPYGKGGLLDFLSTAGVVVPDLLPDLMILDVDELGAAVQTGLIQPLDGLVPQDLLADMYPFAREAATFNGQLYGLQFQANLDHLVYNTSKLISPPRSWSNLLSGPGPYLFPAGGKAGLVNDAFLVQYLAVRDQSGASGSDGPFLDADNLAKVLQFYYDALSSGIVPAKVLGYHTTDDVWNDYAAGQAALAQVNAHRYLLAMRQSPPGGDLGDRLSNSSAAAVPTANGSAAPIGRGWALVLVTSDPARRAAAANWMVQLMSPAANAAWNEAADYLPTRATAMAGWRAGDSYSRFIQQQLQAARPRPQLADYTRMAAALQEAVTAVLNGTATPQEASQAVAGSQ
ncbi:MAG: extracellular solute-binding protein [Anaerolineae bacterium]|nr:extracellular solute-binding protein [Anaerolineae bacterium]